MTLSSRRALNQADRIGYAVTGGSRLSGALTGDDILTMTPEQLQAALNPGGVLSQNINPDGSISTGSGWKDFFKSLGENTIGLVMNIYQNREEIKKVQAQTNLAQTQNQTVVAAILGEIEKNKTLVIGGVAVVGILGYFIFVRGKK